jgi:predicted RNase H-like nuclease
LIEGLQDATPALHLNDEWAALHARARAATRPSQLRREEDPVDAVICAYVALFFHHRPHDVTVYGDYATGYLVTPTLPPERAPKAAPAQRG